ncbi:ankyrin repeat domain-containing protein [Sulfuriferula sp.]|uniref:ankyrin repeat domain-containing protein n=1 Tax=Sulfuriferula sp. TaxID=2025307 RepID=UPI002730D71E|nr:ankyrin repeat domain-containing protein [Sulfuriferula sp.]MDP2026563.1 ankyrin repeat domain-containing protein [Sulfuriferula sp.]
MKNERIFRRIDAAAASQLLARDNVLVLDSRDQDSFGQARIASARRLSSDNLDATLLGTPKATPVLLYCYHGNASQIYGQMFADFGFAEVYSLDGGFEAWQQLHLKTAPPVLSPQLAHWLQQHGYPCNNLEAVAEHGMTPLMRASKSGDTAIVFELIQAGASPHTQNGDGNHALWLACVGANPDTLDVLIRAGSALDHQNDNGASCLMYAASTGKHAVVEKLLAAGANPQLKTLDDFSALDMAATIECLRLLHGVEKRLLQAVG